MSWYCPTELMVLTNLSQTPYPCCIPGTGSNPPPGTSSGPETVYATQQECQDDTNCCTNANQPGTNNLSPCCGGIDSASPCNQLVWLSLTQNQKDALCQYCGSSPTAPNMCESQFSIYCQCCDGCVTTTTTTPVLSVQRGVKRCPQFGPLLEFMAQPWNNPLYSIVWSYPLGTILHLQISFMNFYDGSWTHYIACWEVVEFSAFYVCAEANGVLLTPTPVLCDPCPVPPGPSCTTTTTSEAPRPPHWCIKKCCDDSFHKIDATFPWDWSAILGSLVPGTVFLAQSFNNLNGTGLQECYSLPDPPVFDCGNYPTLALAPPTVIFAQTSPPQPNLCDNCLFMYEYGQIGDVYQWFPPALPPPTGQAVDTGVDADLCVQITTTTTTNPSTTTTTTLCIWGCTIPMACNYDPLATCDDNSCTYAVYGCSDSGACIGTACPDGGTCASPTSWFQSPYPGCAAANYYAGASFNDGSCYAYCNCLEPAATNYNFTGEIGVPPAPAPAFTNGVYVDCAGAFQMTGINWNGNAGDTSCCGPIVTTTTTLCIWGCTLPGSTNYCPTCTCDDGSCIPILYGCMDYGCCTSGVGPDPLVGDPCPSSPPSTYQLCPPLNYNSPLPPPGAINYYAGASLDDGSCIYPPLEVTFFEVPHPPCVVFWGTICCANTYNINIAFANAATIPQGTIKFTFEAYTTNPGVLYDANAGAVYTHNTVSSSLDFDDEVFTTCVATLGTSPAPYTSGLVNAIGYEGAVPIKVIVELTDTQGTIFTGEAVLQDFATASNISVGYTNNWDGTNTQTCDLTASSPGGIGGCV